MTTQDDIAAKTVVLHEDTDNPQTAPAYLLLSQLGHEVRPTVSAEAAVELLRHCRVDLLVIDTAQMTCDQLVARLDELPPDQLPREIAVFCDRSGTTLSARLGSISRSRVHVLLKPLHMHGLLGVLRKVKAAV